MTTTHTRKHAAYRTNPVPSSCGCLTTDQFRRTLIGIVVGIFIAQLLFACPVLFVALPVLAFVCCAGALFLEMAWTALRWLGHYLFGLPRPVGPYGDLGRLPRPRWHVYVTVAWVVLYLGSLVAAIVFVR